MNRYLSLSRAARLVGIKRGTLQKRIQAGDISTFEGEVSVEELLKAYPQTELEDSTMIEHTRKIKDAAVGRMEHDVAVMPSSDILISRMNKLSFQLHEAISRNEHYQTALRQLEELLRTAPTLEQIDDWLHTTLNQPFSHDPASSHILARDTYLRLMSAHVRIMPSGHDFFQEGNSTLLEAGLRSGLALDYACSNGNCGKCKARLISGDIEKVRNHDYLLSDAEKSSGDFLMCCNTAITDVVIEAEEAGSVQDIPRQSILAKVKKIEFPNDSTALLHIKTPRSDRLRFLAGQYVALQAEDMQQAEDISIASCPCDDMNLHFHVPRNDSELSQHVFNDMKSGDAVEVTGPAGDFVMDETSFQSLVFIACNTGFAPVKSLIEHAMALDIAEDIHLFWITADAEDRYQHNLCRSWEDALDNFHFHPVDSSLADPERPNDQSRSVIDHILEQLDDTASYDFYVAGNRAITGSCQSALLQKGVHNRQLKVDNLHHD